MGLETQQEVSIDHEINDDNIVETMFGMRSLKWSIEEITQ